MARSRDDRTRACRERGRPFRRARRHPAIRGAQSRRRRAARSARTPAAQARPVRAVRSTVPRRGRRATPPPRARERRSARGGLSRDSIYTGLMILRLFLTRTALACLAIALVAVDAAAQTGRVGGTVKDDMGQAIKGATITAENPNASPSSFTATTDDKGRFSIIGLRSGQWTFMVQAPGFAPEGTRMNVQTIGQPNPPIEFKLKKSAAAPVSALGNVAEVKFAKGQTEEAAKAYQKAAGMDPTWGKPLFKLALVQLNKGDKDATIKALEKVIAADPTSSEATQAKAVIEQLKK